jgi:hypothetical protein
VARPAIHIGTIDVHVAAAAVSAPVAIRPAPVSTKTPAATPVPRLSRPAAIFGLAQG